MQVDELQREGMEMQSAYEHVMKCREAENTRGALSVMAQLNQYANMNEDGTDAAGGSATGPQVEGGGWANVCGCVLFSRAAFNPMDCDRCHRGCLAPMQSLCLLVVNRTVSWCVL